MNVRLHGILPEGLGLHFMHHGNRMDLSPDTQVEVDVAPANGRSWPPWAL